MALPKLETPKHSCVLPTLEETVYYRPFLVGEQKMLLIAQESDDTDTQIKEMMRLINVCCDDIDVDKLPSIDLEFLFLQIRIKSVGETSSVIFECDKCNQENTVVIDLESAEVKRDPEEVDKLIPLTDSVTMELQRPSYSMMDGMNLQDENTNDLFKLMSKCVVSITDGDEVHTRDDFKEKELMAFFDSMSLVMFENVQNYFNTATTLVLDAGYDCTDCSNHNNVELIGIANFFE